MKSFKKRSTSKRIRSTVDKINGRDRHQNWQINVNWSKLNLRTSNQRAVLSVLRRRHKKNSHNELRTMKKIKKCWNTLKSY